MVGECTVLREHAASPSEAEELISNLATERSRPGLEPTFWEWLWSFIALSAAKERRHTKCLWQFRISLIESFQSESNSFITSRGKLRSNCWLGCGAVGGELRKEGTRFANGEKDRSLRHADPEHVANRTRRARTPGVTGGDSGANATSGGEARPCRNHGSPRLYGRRRAEHGDRELFREPWAAAAGLE